MNHCHPILLLRIGVKHCEFLTSLFDDEMNYVANVMKSDHIRSMMLDHIKILHHTLHHHNYPHDGMYSTTTTLTD